MDGALVAQTHNLGTPGARAPVRQQPCMFVKLLLCACKLQAYLNSCILFIADSFHTQQTGLQSFIREDG